MVVGVASRTAAAAAATRTADASRRGTAAPAVNNESLSPLNKTFA